jgi:hypothetical protein
MLEFQKMVRALSSFYAPFFGSPIVFSGTVQRKLYICCDASNTATLVWTGIHEERHTRKNIYIYLGAQ